MLGLNDWHGADEDVGVPAGGPQIPRRAGTGAVLKWFEGALSREGFSYLRASAFICGSSIA